MSRIFQWARGFEQFSSAKALLLSSRSILYGSVRQKPANERARRIFCAKHALFNKALWEKNLGSFDAIERYGRELERRKAIKERYRSPPRREKSRRAGTNYMGPHRATHKVAAVAEVSGADENGTPANSAWCRIKSRNQWRHSMFFAIFEILILVITSNLLRLVLKSQSFVKK